MGTMFAGNFGVAHELFHKEDWLARVTGSLTLSKNLYMHYFIAHTWGHHRNVATPLDSGYAKFGESFYGFLSHAIVGNFKDGWSYECKKLKALRPDRSIWVPQNRMIWFALNMVVFPVLVLMVFGWYGMVTYVLLSMKSIMDLEAINYVEHYGLTRKELSPGVYEKVTIRHSWNAPQRLSNYFLYKVQRHSDHHENAYKPYQTLLTLEESPMLPGGYFICLVAAYQPKVWFAIMDPLTIAYNKGVKLEEKEEKRISGLVNECMWKNLITGMVLFLSVAVYRIYS